MFEAAVILAVAFLLDLLLGDPVYRLHPVRCIGYMVHGLESLLWRLHFNGFCGGSLLTILMLMVTMGVSLGISMIFRYYSSWAMWIWHVYVVTSCIALRDLIDHARAIVQPLRIGDLTQSRVAVQCIVGRDAALLNEAGVARATVETVAENFVDSLLSPLFWYVVGVIVLNNATGGLAALVVYRTVNTLDAMVGYRSERYLFFGRAAARLDDVLSFIPARLSVFILSLSAAICGKDGLGALKVAWRDRKKHVSPNAGHPESCMAGALGIRLGGPVVYRHGIVDKPWLGSAQEYVTATHIDVACQIVFVSGCLSCALTFVVLIVVT